MPIGRTKQLRPKEVLFDKGDAGDEMYVILKGKVLLVDGAWDRGGSDGVVMNQGEFFGELALVKPGPRIRTAVAVEPSVLLCINRSELNQLVKEQPSMAARILQALDDREDGKSSAEADPKSLDTMAKASDDDPDLLPLTNFDSRSQYLFLKALTCPVCETRFQTETVRESRLAVDTRYPDFRVRYKDFEPLWYRYVVCPKCLFTSKRSEFEAALGEKVVTALKKDQQARTAKFGVFDFSRARDASLGLISVRLAEHCCAIMHKPAYDRAAVALHLMWLYEDAQNKAEAQESLKRATDLYVEAYQTDRSSREPKIDQRLAYLVGWLSYRLYRTQQAISFVSEAMKWERQGDKVVTEMVRDLLPSIRKRKQDEENGASQIEEA